MPMPHPAAPAHEFRYDTGRLCLDLLATAHPVDRLDTVLQLRRWCSGAGLVPPGTVLACATPGWLAAFRDLRDIVDGLTRTHLATATGAGRRSEPAAPVDRSASPTARPAPSPATTRPAPAGPPRSRSAARERAIERLNSLAREAPPAPRAVRAADGTLVRALHVEPGCAALLAAVARDAVDLLTDPASPARLRECEGATCGRIYLDTSRGRRRRWCSGGVCGNRARVARHRQRSTAEAGR